MPPPRIVTVSAFFASHNGGIERVAGQINRQLWLARCQVTWLASSEDEAPGSDNVSEVIPVACWNPTERLLGLPMPLPGPKAVRDIARAVRASDGVIIHDALYVTSILALFCARFYRKPHILVQHIGKIPFANPLLRAILALANGLVTQTMLRAAQHVVFISDQVRRDLLGARPKRAYHLVFNGVDHQLFRADATHDREAIRRELAVPASKPLILFVGRLVEKKGLRIIEAIARARPQWYFALAGAGPIRPQDWALDNVQLLGMLAPRRLAELYRSADLLLLPSHGEGYPLVIQEALACGLPVICGEDSAAADPNARAFLSGIKIDPRDTKGSAARSLAAIELLLATPPDRAAMAAYAKATYDWQVMAGRLLALLESRQADGSG